jgi:hypothetical protein
VTQITRVPLARARRSQHRNLNREVGDRACPIVLASRAACSFCGLEVYVGHLGPVQNADFLRHTRKIMTSVAFMRAAAVCPGFSCISRADLAVMIEMICWPPIEISTSAIRPLIRTASIRPTS